jgi:glycerophosphoryl diester phosphodiesterase
MEAFEYAVGLGYRYVETDVQVTADGVLVAFHDNDLRRTCGVAGRISDLPWEKVAAARVDGRAPIPLLDELLAAWPDLRLNIDCKSDAAIGALIASLRRHDALHRVCVGAFSDRRLARLRHELGDQLCSSLGPLAVARFLVAPPQQVHAHAAQVPVRQGPITVVNERFVANAHQRGVHVHVWTIDDPDEMRRLLDLGVDGVMTDRPGVLRQVLTERGEWQ